MCGSSHELVICADWQLGIPAHRELQASTGCRAMHLAMKRDTAGLWGKELRHAIADSENKIHASLSIGVLL